MNEKEWVASTIIFVSAMFFSAMSWLNSRAKNDKFIDGKTPPRVKVEGITHSLIGGLISVFIFAIVSHFKPDWGQFLHGTIAVTSGALLSETIIMFMKKRIENG